MDHSVPACLGIKFLFSPIEKCDISHPNKEVTALKHIKPDPLMPSQVLLLYLSSLFLSPDVVS